MTSRPTTNPPVQPAAAQPPKIPVHPALATKAARWPAPTADITSPASQRSTPGDAAADCEDLEEAAGLDDLPDNSTEAQISEHVYRFVQQHRQYAKAYTIWAERRRIAHKAAETEAKKKQAAQELRKKMAEAAQQRLSATESKPLSQLSAFPPAYNTTCKVSAHCLERDLPSVLNLAYMEHKKSSAVLRPWSSLQPQRNRQPSQILVLPLRCTECKKERSLVERPLQCQSLEAVEFRLQSSSQAIDLRLLIEMFRRPYDAMVVSTLNGRFSEPVGDCDCMYDWEAWLQVVKLFLK